MVVDGAHNPDAAEKLKASLEMYFHGRKLIFLMGVLKDKQYDKIASILAPMAKEVITLETPDNGRALSAEKLAETVRKYNGRVQAAKSLSDAVNQGMNLAEKEDVVVAFGSLSFTGEITRLFREWKGYRREEC